jgi:hypothetical protein
MGLQRESKGMSVDGALAGSAGQYAVPLPPNPRVVGILERGHKSRSEIEFPSCLRSFREE